jgi:hypothetical protein
MKKISKRFAPHAHLANRIWQHPVKEGDPVRVLAPSLPTLQASAIRRFLSYFEERIMTQQNRNEEGQRNEQGGARREEQQRAQENQRSQQGGQREEGSNRNERSNRNEGTNREEGNRQQR